MTTTELAALISFLDRMPAQTGQLASALNEDGLRWKPSAGEFSFVEHLCHLRDIEREGYAIRIQRLLSEENPYLPDLDGAKLAIERQYNDQDFQEALTKFAQARRANVAVLKNVSAAQLSQSGTFEHVGPITLEALLVMMREHDEGHLCEIQVLREKILNQQYSRAGRGAR